MVGPSHPKSLLTLHIFSMKSQTSTITSMKLKTLFQTFIFSHFYRIARAITKAKSILLDILKDIQIQNLLELPTKKSKNKNKNKVLFGSFRLHYNWCSSHVTPMPLPESQITNHMYYEDMDESELSGYLNWLEEKGDDNSSTIDDIDKLADKFISSCHEKFRLEKQESYRRFQEMMARSV